MSNLGDGIAQFLVIAIVAIPLAIWKVVDIAIWFFSHVSWK